MIQKIERPETPDEPSPGVPPEVPPVDLNEDDESNKETPLT